MRHFSAAGGDVADLLGYGAEALRVDAVVQVTHEGFAAELEQNPLAHRLLGHISSLRLGHFRRRRPGPRWAAPRDPLYSSGPSLGHPVAHTEAREPPDLDVLAYLTDDLAPQVVDGLVGILDERLLEKHHLGDTTCSACLRRSWR